MWPNATTEEKLNAQGNRWLLKVAQIDICISASQLLIQYDYIQHESGDSAALITSQEHFFIFNLFRFDSPERFSDPPQSVLLGTL